MSDQMHDEALIEDGLRIARLLARTGFPIFRSASELHELPAGKWGWDYPRGWQNTKPGRNSLAAIDSWKPGYALCMVSGVTADYIDIDVQHGASIDDIPAGHVERCVVATQRTPSGGWHLVLYRMDAGSPQLAYPGIELKGGSRDGSSRRFIHIAPTIGVSKVDGRTRRPYQWDSPGPDLDREIEESDLDAFRGWLLAGARPGGSAGAQDKAAAELWDYADGVPWLLEHGIPEGQAQRPVFLKVTRELVQEGLDDEEILLQCELIASKSQEVKGDPWKRSDFANMLKKPRAEFGRQVPEDPADLPGTSDVDVAGKPAAAKATKGNVYPPPGDPMGVARKLLAAYTDMAGRPTLIRWRGGWYSWDGDRWPEMDKEDLRTRIYLALEKAVYLKKAPVTGEGEKPRPLKIPWSPNRNKVGDVMEAMTSLRAIGKDIEAPAWIGKRPAGISEHVIPMQGGLLDRKSRVLYSPTPAYFNLTSVAIEYDPDAPEPAEWHKFTAELWPGDEAAISALGEMFGYSISESNRQQKIMLLAGPKRSGKGTIAKVLKSLMGSGNVVHPDLASLKGEFGKQQLIGKSLAIVGDARQDERQAGAIVELLLSISGDDDISVNRKNRDFWTGHLGVRFLVLSNKIPEFEDSSGAIASRFFIIHMLHSFIGKEDPGIFGRLRLELPGIFNWALDGLDRLEDRGHMLMPASAADAVATMLALASPIQEFLDDYTVAPGVAIPRAGLYAKWDNWATKQGRTPGTEQQFGVNLRAAVPGVTEYRPRVNGQKGPRWYVGVAVRSPVVGFVRDRFRADHSRSYRITASDLFTAWKAWTKEDKRRGDPGTLHSFTESLKDVVPWIDVPEVLTLVSEIKGISLCK